MVAIVALRLQPHHQRRYGVITGLEPDHDRCSQRPPAPPWKTELREHAPESVLLRDSSGKIVNAASRRISTKRRGRRFYYGLGRQSYSNAPGGTPSRHGDFFVLGQSRRDMVM